MDNKLQMKKENIRQLYRRLSAILSMADAVVHNPAFSSLPKRSKFKRIVEKLQMNCI